MADPRGELIPGVVVEGRWRVVTCIGRGGMSELYEVRHARTTKRAALKVMLLDYASSSVLRERFKQEMTVTASLESDHIVQVFDGGADESLGLLYLVLELLRGEDLRAARERSGGRFDGPIVAEYLEQAALGLDLAHAAGIVHRDLKPENLFLTYRDDARPCIKVLDFGVAKYIAESVGSAKTTQAIGTPLYMSPEQIRGDGTIGYAADVYSMAQVAYDLLVGEPYWESTRRQTSSLYGLLMAITAGVKTPATLQATERGVRLPPEFDAWFARATADDPLDRHPSIVEAARELSCIFPALEGPATLRG
jgi:eukaryotic-like serine/threonine-protein kinase